MAAGNSYGQFKEAMANLRPVSSLNAAGPKPWPVSGGWPSNCFNSSVRKKSDPCFLRELFARSSGIQS